MRVPFPCWPVVAGLAVFGHAFLATHPAHGWDQNPLRGSATATPDQGSSQVRVMGTISDEMVQQAGHATPARGNSQPPHSGGQFHGMPVNFPKMPFSRGGGAKNPPEHGNQSSAVRQAGGALPAQQPARSSGRFVTPNAAGSTARIMPGTATTSNSMPPDPRTFNSQNGANMRRPAQMAPNQMPPDQAAIARRLAEPRPLAVMPEVPHGQAQRSPAHDPHRQAHGAVQASRMVPQREPVRLEATPAAAQSPADRLIVQAHALSTKAKTIEDYTTLIETCRRTKASQPSPAVAKYAGELTGWALNRRGQLKADAGELREAMLDFEDAIRADSNCWRAVHNRGVLLAQSGQFEKAFDDFNRTIGLNGNFAKAYSNRAALFVVAGDLMPALQDYGRAIELDPNLAVAHRGRGRVCHLLGRLDESIGHYDAAVQLTPNDGYAIASRADLLTDLGRYADAVADYERAIELDPESPHAYRGLAWLSATSPDGSVRDPERAMELAQHALTLDDNQDSVTFDTLAAAQASSGDFPAAMKSLHKAIEIAPDGERTVYQNRLVMYQHAKPFRISPVRPVTQASYETR